MLMPLSRVSAGTRPTSFCAWASGCCEPFKTTCSELVISERMRGVGDCAPSTPAVIAHTATIPHILCRRDGANMVFIGVLVFIGDRNFIQVSVSGRGFLIHGRERGQGAAPNQ